MSHSGIKIDKPTKKTLCKALRNAERAAAAVRQGVTTLPKDMIHPDHYSNIIDEAIALLTSAKASLKAITDEA